MSNDTLDKIDTMARECIDAGDPVTIESMSPGQGMAQGDLCIWRKERIPDNASVLKDTWQLANGNTKGSRHIIARNPAVTVYRYDTGDVLSDLWVEATDTWELTHPEHANITFPPGCYQVLHQQNGQRERVID